MINPSFRASSLEVEDAVHCWGLMNTGLRLASEGSEAQREIKEELFDTEHSEDEDVTKPSVADASDPTHFSIAIVGVTAVAGIGSTGRAIDFTSTVSAKGWSRLSWCGGVVDHRK